MCVIRVCENKKMTIAKIIKKHVRNTSLSVLLAHGQHLRKCMSLEWLRATELSEQITTVVAQITHLHVYSQ